MAQSWEGSECPLNAHSATPVVPLTRRGGQEKGKGHGSESKTGDPGGGEGVPECRVPARSGLATPSHVLEAGRLCGARLGQGAGSQVRKLWPSKDVGQGG